MYFVNPTSNYSVHPGRQTIATQVHPGASLSAHPEFRGSSVLPMSVELTATRGVTIATGVSAWADPLGGKSVLQGAGAAQPSFTASNAGFNGQPSVDGDGAAKFLTGSWPLVQPEHVFACAKYNAAFVSGDTLIDGSVADSMEFRRTGAASIAMYAGAFVTASGAGIGTPTNAQFYGIQFNSPNCKITRDGQLTNGVGDALGANGGGLTLFARFGPLLFANASISYVAVASRIATPAEELVITRAVCLKNGIVTS